MTSPTDLPAVFDGTGYKNKFGQPESSSVTLPPVGVDQTARDAAAAALAAAASSSGGGATPTAVKAANYTAVKGDLVNADATAGAFTITLPTGQSAGATVAVKKLDTSGNAVTVAAGAGSTIVTASSGGTLATAASGSLTIQETRTYVFDGTSKWYVLSGNVPKSVLDGIFVARAGLPVYGAKDSTFGAAGDAKAVLDGAISASSAALSSTAAAFTTADQGKTVMVEGAGAAGARLVTTISSVSGGVATLAATASTTVAGACVTWGTDDTTALAAWATAANGHKAFLPAGMYLTTATVVFPNPATEIYGEGAGRSIICTTLNTTTGLKQGNTSGNNGVVPGGVIHDLSVWACGGYPWLPPATQAGSVGVQLVNNIQGQVNRVDVRGFDIGFDLVNNCYGTGFDNCRAPFNYNNVGLNLRTGGQSGSDLTFVNCWLGGQVAAVHITSGGGGYHFYGGQFTGGNAQVAQQDNYGVLTTGKDYLTGTTGDGCGNLTFDGVSWEGWHYLWAIRTYGECMAHFLNSNINSTSSGNFAIGVLKMDNAKASKLMFESCSLGGSFTPGTGRLVTIAGQFGGLFSLTEMNWMNTSQALTVDGTNVDIRVSSLIQQSGYTFNNGLVVNGKGVYAGAGQLVQLGSYGGVFGDGSDGAVVLDGTNSYGGWSSKSGNTYTMTRDVFATTLTVAAGVTLLAHGCRIFATQSVTNNGTISTAGNAGGADGTAGATHTSLLLASGAAGGAGNTGAGGAGQAGCVGYANGPNGGTGSSGAGGTGGGIQSGTTAQTIFRVPMPVLTGVVGFQSGSKYLGGAPGGAGGGGDGTNKGGGGGEGGSMLVILAPTITNASGATLTSVGGNGGTPTTGNCGGGAPGGGGHILTYSRTSITQSGTQTAAAGTPGSGVGSGTAGSTGTAGLIRNTTLA